MIKYFTIRVAKKSDSILLSTLNFLFNGITIEPSTIEERIKTNHEIIIVAEYKEDILGFGCAQIFTSFCYPNAIMEITELYVREEYRKNGIARKIINKIEEFGSETNISEIRIETGSNNIEAKNLYAVMGYARQNESVYKKIIKDLGREIG
jgi:ribosomal protein S18 acetylase RimI-like enzyme